MFAIDRTLLVAAVLLLVGIFASKFASRLGLPVLVLFILVGMLAGDEGLGRIAFDQYGLAHGIATVALCFILFDGGLRTPRQALRLAWRPAGLLASVGVVLTSLVTGFAATAILGIPLLEGLLLGAIVGSTDAAAVFSVLRSKGLHLEERLASTLEVESGSNDPMAIFLTVGFLEVLTGEMTLGPGLLLFLAKQMGIGLLTGGAVGYLAVRLINRIRLDAAGLYPVLAGVCGLISFGLAAVLGGSGFLAVYLTGIWIGNQRFIFQRGTLLFHDGLAWIGQIVMFVVLGLLATPSQVLETAGPGLLIAAVLIFVARPLAVFPLLLPFGFRFAEITFIAWTGLKGAVPIVLATYPLLFGLEDGLLFFNVIFFVVLVSAVTQGWSLPFVARWLGLQQTPEPAPSMSLEITSLRHVDAEIVGYALRHGTRALGRPINRLALPDGLVVAMVSRDEKLTPPRGSTLLKEGDHVFVVMKDEVRPLADRLFGFDALSEKPLPVYVEFPFPGLVRLGDLERSYSIDLEGGRADETLADCLQRLAGGEIGPGAFVEHGGYRLYLRKPDGDGATVVGIVCSPLPVPTSEDSGEPGA
jgi:cell volume regulation protein A